MQELGALLSLALRNLELYEAMGFANRALQESSSFKDDLLAMLAHDFKGPLTVILGYCELMLEASDDHREEIETVYSQTKRLVRLSDDALVLAQTQAEGFSLARTVVDLGAFVAECCDATALNNPRLEVAVPREPIPVDLDPHRFRHVIDNLVSNALKYSTDQVRDSRLQRRESRHHRGQRPRHRDSGRRARARSSRASAGRATLATKASRGSGIGLYVARKIVEVHRGTISVRSKENEGSTFIVSLPILGT